MKKLFKIASSLAAFALAVLLGINFFVMLRANTQIAPKGETKPLAGTPDYVLVLGCGVRADGSPSRMLWERLQTACEVLDAYPIETKLLLSGDHSGSYDEVSVMRRICLENGVDPDRIVCDEQGFSTFESLRNAKETFGAQNLIIITQPYHLYRAVFIAQRLGFNKIAGVSADLPFYPKQILWSAREIFARNKDFWLSMFAV